LQHYQQQRYVWKCALVTVGVFLLLGLEVRALITVQASGFFFLNVVRNFLSFLLLLMLFDLGF